jgi:hypothetical protein
MGFRVVYFDTSRDLPGMLEIIEMNADAEEGFHKMYQADPGMGRKSPHSASPRTEAAGMSRLLKAP